MSREFDETADYLTVAYHSALALPDGDWTVQWWLRCDDITGTGYQYFHSWNWAAGAANERFYGYIAEASEPFPANGAPFIKCEDASGNVQQVYTSEIFPSNDWYHILVRRTGSGTSSLQVFVNGSNDTTYQDNADFNGINPSTGFEIGRRDDANATRYWGGRIAEHAKWDRALTDGEIAALARGAPVLRFATDLKVYIPILGIGSIEPNYAGTGVDAGVVSAPPYAPHPSIQPIFSMDEQSPPVYTATAELRPFMPQGNVLLRM